jgi:hypothetical protein
MSPNDQGVELAAHEGGHNLTLHHAKSLDYGSEALGPLNATGALSEYGDKFSSMGYWNLSHYAVQHKLKLGWMPAGNVLTVQGPGSYSLHPYELGAASLQALKVQRGIANDNWLWVEYRRPVGNYDTALNSQVYSGALIHYLDSNTGTYTDLLDFTPQTSSFNDPALPAGKTWTDSYTNVAISVTGATSSALTVDVSYESVPHTTAGPGVSISPSNSSAQAGDSVDYTLSVMNNDSAGCSSRTFDVSSTQPSGWLTSFSQASLTLSPSQTASVTMTKSVPDGTAPGTYPVDAHAADGADSGSGSANCTVTAPPPPLTVSLSVPGSTYTVRSTVPITATVLAGGDLTSGARVTLTLTKAGGKQTSKILKADSSGQATWNYRIGRKDPKGTYSVTGKAVYRSRMAPSNTATFTVQ